jgi:DNA-binding Lrp family transcriptional regulator
MPPLVEYEYHSRFNDDYTLPTRRIVRILSENSRTSLTKIAEQLGVSRRTVQNRLRSIEKALEIRYTLELDENKLGVPTPHIVVMEFAKKPDYNHVSNLLKKSYIPQLAFTLKGKNQICVYAIAASPTHYARWNSTMGILLSKYGVNIFSSDITHKQLGFVQLRNELIDRLEIEPNTKNLIKLLNENSRASIQQLSKGLGKHFNTVTYTFNKLVGSGYIKRFTLTMGRQADMVPARFLIKYMVKEHRERDSAKARLAIKADDKDSIVNRYIFNSSLVGAWDHFGLGVFDSYKTGYEHCVGYYKQTMGRHIVRMDFDTIEKVLIGRLPLRSIDTRAAYNVLNWTEDLEGI